MATDCLVNFYTEPSRRPMSVLQRPFVRPAQHQSAAITTTPMTYSMLQSTAVPPLSNVQSFRPLPAASSNSGSISSDDSQHLNNLPGAVIGDFPASDFYPWRDSNLDQPWSHLPITSPDEYVTTQFDSTAQGRMRSGFRDDLPRQTVLGLPRQSVGEQTLYSARSPTLLAGPVDTSEFEHVEDMHWACSVTEYDDNATSPGTIDSHSSGPRTPASPHDSEGSGIAYGDRVHDGVRKTESTFDSFPSTTSMQALMPAAMPTTMSSHGLALQSRASFGNMTLAAAFAQPAVWHMTAAPPHGAYHTHTHGLPNQGHGFVSSHDLHHGVHPSAVYPVFSADADTCEDFGRASPEDSPEVYSDSGSEVDIEEKLDQDMNDRALQDAQARRSRDKYLLKMRSEGFSYKEIKRRGNFREAESTLRGRVRVLTKDKADRVRRPEWTVEDLRLLDAAVSRFSGTQGRGRGRDGGRLPWKKVADYLVQHGSSYHFAAATCARKWKELE